MASAKFLNVQQKLSLANAMPSIKNGDLLFCGGNGNFSNSIKKLSDSHVSHVGIIFWWGQNLMLLESVLEVGVRAIPLFHYTGNYNHTGKKYDGTLFVARHKGVTNDKLKLEAMQQVAIDLFGFKYDSNDIFKILASRFSKKVKRKEDDAFICSEYVDKIFEMVNIKFNREASGFIFPEHIAADANVEVICELV
jgi:hypothetical protein